MTAIDPIGCPSRVSPPNPLPGRQRGPATKPLTCVPMPHIEPCRPHLVLADPLKLLRETLCIAQSAIAESHVNWCKSHGERLQRLINEIDRQRPLGPDGKHGDRHTETCGCERPGLHCAHWHLGVACCRCSEPAPPTVEHAPEIAGPDGLGYGHCVACRELWPCTTRRAQVA